jgi:branched-subunit amino acid ABC-type transport system permease component
MGMDVLEFGDRSGSWVAFAFFSAIFLLLAIAVWREIRRRAPELRRVAAAIAVLLFVAPVALIYASSLNGFYEAEIRDGRLVLRYLFPTASDLPLADVQSVRAAPAFRGRWRVHIVRADGAEYESAIAQRDAVNEAVERLRRSIRSAEPRD